MIGLELLKTMLPKWKQQSEDNPLLSELMLMDGNSILEVSSTDLPAPQMEPKLITPYWLSVSPMITGLSRTHGVIDGVNKVSSDWKWVTLVVFLTGVQSQSFMVPTKQVPSSVSVKDAPIRFVHPNLSVSVSDALIKLPPQKDSYEKIPNDIFISLFLWFITLEQMRINISVYFLIVRVYRVFFIYIVNDIKMYVHKYFCKYNYI